MKKRRERLVILINIVFSEAMLFLLKNIILFHWPKNGSYVTEIIMMMFTTIFFSSYNILRRITFKRLLIFQLQLLEAINIMNPFQLIRIVFNHMK